MLLGNELEYQERVKVNRPLFLVVGIISLGGFLFCGAEVALSTVGKTLCHAETCSVVEDFSVLSRRLMAALAALYFLLQALGAFGLWWSKRSPLRPLIFLSAAGLGAETIFVLRQFLDYHLHCPFCLIVAALVVSSSSLVLLASRRRAAFGAVMGVALGMALTPLSVAPLPKIATKHIERGKPTEVYYLVYSDRCPHCHEVLAFCDTVEDLDLYLCPKNKALALLQTLDIPGVPVMVVDRKGEKEVLIGSGVIINYLKNKELPETGLESILSPRGICREDQKCEPQEPLVGF